MSRLLFLLTQSVLNVASEVSGTSEGPLPLGIIVVAIIEAPVLILLIATLIGKPRQPKITSVFIGFIAMMVILFIGAVFGLSYILGVFY